MVLELTVVLSQVSADKLDSITAFPKFFSQTSYTKLASYRRAIFQALEASLRSMCVCGGGRCVQVSSRLGPVSTGDPTVTLA